MKVNEATALAKKYVRESLSDATAPDLRLENFVYDDHLAVWTVTLSDLTGQRIVRISNGDGSLISIR
jgi:hypothetical protein